MALYRPDVKESPNLMCQERASDEELLTAENAEKN
jgi:hypothetical protein